MYIVSFMGSPRRHGNTDILLGAVLEGAREAGATCTYNYLAGMDFKGCTECDYCRKTGVCSLEDDFTPLYNEIERADAVIVSSPMFFYNITSLTQAVVERAQAPWVARYRLGRSVTRNCKGIFISVGATKGPSLFDGALLVLKYFFDAIGAEMTGSLLVRGVEARGDIKKHSQIIKEAKDFGAKIGSGLLPGDLSFTV